MDVHFAYVSPRPLGRLPYTPNAGTPASNKRLATATSVVSRKGEGKKKGGVAVSIQEFLCGRAGRYWDTPWRKTCWFCGKQLKQVEDGGEEGKAEI